MVMLLKVIPSRFPSPEMAVVVSALNPRSFKCEAAPSARKSIPLAKRFTPSPWIVTAVDGSTVSPAAVAPA